jgi:hypothetical protein
MFRKSVARRNRRSEPQATDDRCDQWCANASSNRVFNSTTFHAGVALLLFYTCKGLKGVLHSQSGLVFQLVLDTQFEIFKAEEQVLVQVPCDATAQVSVSGAEVCQIKSGSAIDLQLGIGGAP